MTQVPISAADHDTLKSEVRALDASLRRRVYTIWESSSALSEAMLLLVIYHISGSKDTQPNHRLKGNQYSRKASSS